MVDNTRRSLLQYFATTGAISALGVGFINATDNFELANENVNIAKLINQEWYKTMSISPFAYLNQKSISNLTTHSEIESTIQSDFRNDSTVIVNGYILSATEAALIASIS